MELKIDKGMHIESGIDKNFKISTEKTLDNVKDNNKIFGGKDIQEKDLKNAVDKLNKFLEDNKTHAEYEIHDKLNDVMIKIVDDNTGKVIKEIPPQKILDMVAKMCEIVGILFDKKA
ncbi:flagellar protein FlaG [Clostridium sp. USBA 49]|jgi:flagellar protein FlaG|uniref:flagellar protein FlaG n=1 Tax=Clostridium TaxID=1485 RepID=UPI00099B090F|nr:MULTISPECIES: flagellar protein FlaG [Clostridium]SKA72712.1 flagellar protein FlaG [Clostridium sp. USBA 49]